MEYKMCEIVSLYKKEIEHRNIKHKSFRSATLFSLMLILPIIVLGFIKINDNETSNLYENVASLGNPNYLPFVDYSGIVFTDADMYLNPYDDVDIILPINPLKIEEDNDKLLLTVGDNFIVVASEKGIVSDIGENAGVKYIKILHSKDIETIIENIDINGVCIGNIVEKNQQIATAKNDSIIKFKVLVNGKMVKNISFKDNVVSWEE